MNYLHPFDVTSAPRGYFVDLRTSAIHKLRTDYGAREFATDSPFTIDNPIDLMDAAKRPNSTILLTAADYPITKRLVTAPNVIIKWAPAMRIMPTIRTADNWAGGDVMIEPDGSVRFEGVHIDGDFKTTVGIENDQSDVTLWRCLLRRFKNVCFRIVGNASRITAAYSEFTDTKNNHGIGARERTESILIMSCLAHGLGTTGSDDGYSWDIHSLKFEIAGSIAFGNHRGCKLPDGRLGQMHHGSQDDGWSHRYAPVAIWRSGDSWGKTPDDIYLDNLTLIADGSRNHAQISNAGDIFIDKSTINAFSSADVEIRDDGGNVIGKERLIVAPAEVRVQGKWTAYIAPESPPIIPDIPPVDPPTEPTAAALLAEIGEAAALITRNTALLEALI